MFSLIKLFLISVLVLAITSSCRSQPPPNAPKSDCSATLCSRYGRYAQCTYFGLKIPCSVYWFTPESREKCDPSNQPEICIQVIAHGSDGVDYGTPCALFAKSCATKYEVYGPVERTA